MIIDVHITVDVIFMVSDVAFVKSFAIFLMNFKLKPSTNLYRALRLARAYNRLIAVRKKT